MEYMEAQMDRQIEGAMSENDRLHQEREELLQAMNAFLVAQDALDNRETAGPNAEDHFELLRRRNNARNDLDTALARATGGA